MKQCNKVDDKEIMSNTYKSADFDKDSPGCVGENIASIWKKIR